MTPYFDRMDICCAYYLFYVLWHVNGMTARDLDRRRALAKRRESIAVQLQRLGFRPSPLIDLDNLEDNARLIYQQLVERYYGEEFRRG